VGGGWGVGGGGRTVDMKRSRDDEIPHSLFEAGTSH
jgi:hypothetical protein